MVAIREGKAGLRRWQMVAIGAGKAGLWCWQMVAIEAKAGLQRWQMTAIGARKGGPEAVVDLLHTYDGLIEADRPLDLLEAVPACVCVAHVFSGSAVLVRMLEA